MPYAFSRLAILLLAIAVLTSFASVAGAKDNRLSKSQIRRETIQAAASYCYAAKGIKDRKFKDRCSPAELEQVAEEFTFYIQNTSSQKERLDALQAAASYCAAAKANQRCPLTEVYYRTNLFLDYILR